MHWLLSHCRPNFSSHERKLFMVLKREKKKIYAQLNRSLLIVDQSEKKTKRFSRVVHSLPYSDDFVTSIFFFVFIGGGEYIYVDDSQSLQVNQSTKLWSPLIRGPKCLRFCYYMYGGGIRNLDVFLWPREEQDSYLMWRVSGQQSDAWMKAGVDVGFTGESQVSREQNCKGYVMK